MPDKVVFLEDGKTVLRLPIGVESPKGSATFFSAEEMALSLDRASMDAARKSMLNSDIAVSSSSAEAAASLLWETVMELVPGMGATLPRKLERTKDAFGNDKNPSWTPIELIELSFVPGADRMQDFFYKKLSKQAKAILKIFADDGGKKAWTLQQAEDLIMEKAAELNTSQDPIIVFKYYRGSLFERRFLRRTSFEEFAKKRPGASLL